MIIVQLLGGLGNQMFQYGLGRRLALKYEVPLCVDTRLLDDQSPGRHLVNRRYALDVFQAQIQRAPLRNSIRYSADGLSAPVRGFLRLTGFTDLSRRVAERCFGFDSSILECGPAGYFAGLWQSVKYLEPIERVLREDLRFRHGLNAVSQPLACEIRETNSVCVHVRRTDYLSHTAGNSPLQFVGLGYYRNAVGRVLDEVRSPKFFVFSDDLEWCKSELSFIPDATFVGSEHAGEKDGGHMQLMSLCRSFIIPNSTFSWWAAWLCQHSDRKVMLPTTWFRDPNLDSSGLYPEGWISVPVALEERSFA